MSLTDKDYADHLLKLYEGQVVHARHHELLRAQAANYIVVISIALIGLLSSKMVPGGGLEPFGRTAILAALVIINIYGIILSRKHYERSSRHNGVAGAYRKALFELHKNQVDRDLESIREGAITKNDRKFRISQSIPLNALWAALHLIFAGIGIFLFAMAASQAA